jgi:vesicle transport through interaction with t-SNAREs 1
LFGFNDSTSDLDSTAVDQRVRLLSGTERLNESSQRLQNSHRIALETENVGVGILGSLRSQRESIMRTRDTVGEIVASGQRSSLNFFFDQLSEADSYVDRASRTLKGMARR